MKMVSRFAVVTAAITAGCLLGWSADWLSGGSDFERTHWQKQEKLLSPTSAKKHEAAVETATRQQAARDE